MLKTDASADIIRKNICMTSFEGETLLHETELAKEFGISRTPIRQILQRLAYERLVYTKSGVGTVVVPLLEEHRLRDRQTHEGIIQAVLVHDLPNLTVSQHADVLALQGVASVLQSGDAEQQYEVLTRLHAVLARLIADPLLKDAFAASAWRVTRWHMRDLARLPDKATRDLKAIIDSVTAYENREGSDLISRYGGAWVRK